jgi:hypothetical protein
MTFTVSLTRLMETYGSASLASLFARRFRRSSLIDLGSWQLYTAHIYVEMLDCYTLDIRFTRRIQSPGATKLDKSVRQVRSYAKFTLKYFPFVFLVVDWFSEE